MNLPNKLTMLRVILVPFFMFFAAGSHIGTADYNAVFHLVAGVIFAVASLRIFLMATSPAKIIWSPISASLWTPWPINA